ncbi:conjugative transposon protein TraN [Sphingobacterium shayense]|uniref:conjugative transposon protein TraN n=1 Tax=Sphingobacterium shayense TaxID=626343 RepID=UPI001551A98F|nr:conjugative transposon protein TraN [Sphingobacterium shayense]NQD72329.1 conjugative transposon protein TraN [Sphingobacterium shayense]
MKTNILLFILLFIASSSTAHAQRQQATTYQRQLPWLIIAPERTLHIISPEPISYVDISSGKIIGDLPLDNVLRLKLQSDSTARLEAEKLGTVSIVGEAYITQYSLQLAGSPDISSLPVRVNILPIHMTPLDISGVSLSTPQIKNKALQILTGRENKTTVRKNKEFGITMSVNGIYTATDYIFIDLSVTNGSKLKYDPDELRFFIEDKKITKATNVQSIEIEPIFTLHPLGPFKRSFRNIYVIKKVSFPGSKVLKISISEQQISGRTLELKIKYRDILDADSI